jgi:putative intracellular protease/amidase
LINFRPQICFVVTSAPFLKDMATGLWLEELAAPYYVFKDAGYEITMTTPKGGPIP